MRYSLKPMKHALSKKAGYVVGLNAIFTAADTMCAVFLSVYLWVNSHDFVLICTYYMAVYAVTPVVFLLAGWYSQARDRLHMYRIGLALHAVFYGVILCLRERSPQYAVLLGVGLGITWGAYWAGANTLSYDVTPVGKREYFFGLMSAVTGTTGLLAPLVSGAIISLAPVPSQGYLWVFGLVLCLYLVSLAMSFLLPSDSKPRPYRIRRALFPGRDQRDWRLIMWATLSMTGAYSLLPVLLNLLMYMKSENDMGVGAFASVQALAAVVMSYCIGHIVVPRNRRPFLFWGTVLLVFAGGAMMWELSVVTLAVFGFLRALSGPLFGIPYSGVRYAVITRSVEEPSQRIEYISASEIPLAVGRLAALGVIIAVTHYLQGNDLALRIIIFTLCALRIVTYRLVTATDAFRDGERLGTM